MTGTSPPFADGTTVGFGGTGTAHVHTDGMGNIEAIELSGTDSTTKLVIKGPATGTTMIKRIFIDDSSASIASIGSIVLKNVLLGDGVRDSVPDLYVEGKAGKLQLSDFNSYAVIRLGESLPYEVLLPNGKVDATKPSTKSAHPDVTIRNVLGPGMLIDTTPSGLPLDNGGHLVGGGGLGKVVVNNWHDAGAIRTTQSIGGIKLLTGDCFIVFDVDKFHVGSSTIAGVGSMDVQNGSWGSSGSEIEGGVGSFSADAFLAGATLTAASMGKVNMDAGAFAGFIRLTDPNAAGIPTFTVASDFTGSVDSQSPIQKIKVKGDFTGELTAPFIGSITAYSFLGTSTPDPHGGPDHLNEISATAGSLGTLTSTAGVVRNFSITTDQAFKGFNVKLSKLAADTVGIDNVHIQAASIGNISVSLASAANPSGSATGIDLIGIRGSDFVTTGTGATNGNLGNITVTLTGAPGGASATGIQNSTFDALVAANEFGSNPASSSNTLGKIAVKVTGQDGASLGLDNASFSANSIGAIAVSVSRGKAPNSNAHAIDIANFTATGAIGALSIDGDATSSQINALKVWAGANVGAVAVKSKDLTHGTLNNSAILAGQSIVLNDLTLPELLAELAHGTLGAVNVTGSLTGSKLVAGSSIGAVTVGAAMTDSLVLAGAKLGSDGTLGGTSSAADVYQGAAAIAAITVKGSFAKSSIVAGVNPHNAFFGDTDDTAVAGELGKKGAIGAISIHDAGSKASAFLTNHRYAIEAAVITSLKLGSTPVLTGEFPVFFDQGTGEDINDVIVRLRP